MAYTKLAAKKKRIKKKADLLDRQRQAINMRYYQNMTMKEVSEYFGVTVACVSQWMKKYEDGAFERNLDELTKLKLQKYNELQDLMNEARITGELMAARAAIETQIRLLGLDKIGFEEFAEEKEQEYLELTESEIAAVQELMGLGSLSDE